MLFYSLNQRRFKLLILLPIAALLSLLVLYAPFRQEILDRASHLPSGINGSPLNPSSPATDPAPEAQPLSIPEEYDVSPARGEICTQRFSEEYLGEFSSHAISYCSPKSKSEVTCFHSSKRSDGATDSMCFGQGVGFDSEAGKFSLNCAVRDLTPEEKERGLIRFQDIRPYWYETGPPEIFAAGVRFHAPLDGARSIATRASDEDDAPEDGLEHEVTMEEKPSSPPRNFFLIKREGEENVWHCIMEIFSAWMSFDVLRMSRDSSNDSPFFQAPEDISNTQAIILDDRSDGPFFDLWTLFAGRNPMRLHELAEDTAMIETMEDANIIVPLAGSSNPLWQDDWEAENCAYVPTVHVFAQRVLNFYDIPDPGPRKPEDPIVVTFIDRTGSRVLLEKDVLFDELKERNPHISFQSIDFAAISFPEQLRIVRATDVLVGVHGAGLTHALFMREYAGAVVEIQPKQLEVFHPFRNIALLGGLGYFRTHAESLPKQKKREVVGRDEWHWNDVWIEKERLFEVIETAIKSLYGNGAWDHDIN